jgi:hypothetical protein
MKSLKALRLVATAMLISNASWAMESKMATVPTTDLSTAIVEYKPAATTIVEYKPKADTLGMDLKVPATKQAIGLDAIDAKIAQAIQTASPQARSKALQYAKNCTLYTLQLAKSLGLGVLDTAKAALLFSSVFTLDVLSHECGHALMALLCGTDPEYIKVFLFSDTKKWPKDGEPKIKLGFIYSYGDSLGGYMEGWSSLGPSHTPIKNILVYIAGGCGALLFEYTLLATQAFVQEYTNTKDVKKAAKFAITRALTPYQNILEQKGLNKYQLFLKIINTTLTMFLILEEITYAFFPKNKNIENSNGDGERAWNELLALSPSLFEIPHHYLRYYVIPALIGLGMLLIFIKGVTCYYCSFDESRSSTFFDIILDLRDFTLDLSDFTYNTLTAPINTITDPEQYAPYPKAKTTLFMQAMYHCLRNKVLAPAGSKLQQAGTWTKQMGSQALNTVKGWFNRKPKAA